jgi:hypothetical protein
MLLSLSGPGFAYNGTELEDTKLPSHSNDAIATAQSMLYVNGISNPSSLLGTIKDSSDIDYYSFLYQKKATSKGSFSIKLEGIKSGNCYYLYLVDKSNNVLFSSERSGSQNQIIRVPENSLADMANYYIKIKPIIVSTPDASYTILMEDNMRTATATLSSSTYYLYSTNGQKSPSAIFDARKVCNDPNAKVLSVSVSATKNPVPPAYNYLMYVTSSTKAQQNQWYTANWNSEVTGLQNAGVLFKDTWNVAFSATSLNASVHIVGINSPKLKFTYEYDSTAGY